MHPLDILNLYDHEMRRDPPAGRARVHKRPGLTFLTVPPPAPHAGWVLYTQLGEEDVDASIDEMITFFADQGDEFEWKVYDHDTPGDLKGRLARRGFVGEEIEGLLVIDLDAALADFWRSPALDVRRVTSANELAEVADIQRDVWQEPFDRLPQMLAVEMEETPDQISVYLAYAGGRAVSTAWIRFYSERSFAELYGGSTREAYRGQGMYRALVTVRAMEASRRGIRFLAVDTSPMSRPILQKLGFVFLTYTQPFVWRAASNTRTENTE